MNRKWKERLITAGLWLALLCVSGYVALLLFPAQIQEWKNKIQTAITGTINAATEEFLLGENKIAAYFADPTEREASLFDHVTPIVTYMLKKEGTEKLLGKSPDRETEPTETSEESTNLSGTAIQSSEDGSIETTLSLQETAAQTPEPAAGADHIQTEPQPQETPPADSPASDAQPANCIPAGSGMIPKITNLVSSGKYSQQQLADYNYLNSLYVIDKKTSLPPEILNPSVLLTKDLSIKGNNQSPQILIYHTHSQEAFADSAPGDVSQTIVGVGDYLAQILTDTYGYQVIHHKGVYDMTDGKLDRDPAYVKALPDLAKILSDHPSIEVVIDLHRDGVKEDVHLAADVNGTSAAKLMFFNGLCRDENGDRSDVTNPYREDNLSFSLQMALLTKAYYPELFRVIYVRPNQYNQHLCPRSALIECGAQTNTVAEVMNTMPILADILHRTLGS